MRAVWKFPLSSEPRVGVEMPKGARILKLDTQHGTPCLWALVDPQAEREHRVFDIFGTGHPIGGEVEREFVGTFFVQGGAFVFHVFEVTEGRDA